MSPADASIRPFMLSYAEYNSSAASFLEKYSFICTSSFFRFISVSFSSKILFTSVLFSASFSLSLITSRSNFSDNASRSFLRASFSSFVSASSVSVNDSVLSERPSSCYALTQSFVFAFKSISSCLFFSLRV